MYFFLYLNLHTLKALCTTLVLRKTCFTLEYQLWQCYYIYFDSLKKKIKLL